MNDPFESSRSWIRGAHEDILNLHAEFSAFVESNPYTKLVEEDPHCGFDIHKVKLTRNIPEKLSRDTVTVAIALRSALDHAGYAAALACGNKKLRATYFPFARTALDLDNVINRRCKDVPTDIVALFRSFKPYLGGDDLLWALNEIANGGKHRMITAVGQGIGGGVINNFRCTGGVRDFAFPPRWDSAKGEMVLCSIKHGAEAQYDLDISFFIAFGDVEVVRDQSVTTVLQALGRKVEGIVNATEIEARRIGLIA
jgi:hypothetical protein